MSEGAVLPGGFGQEQHGLLDRVRDEVQVSGIRAVDRALRLAPLFKHVGERSEHYLDIALACHQTGDGGTLLLDIPIRDDQRTDIGYASHGLLKKLLANP